MDTHFQAPKTFVVLSKRYSSTLDKKDKRQGNKCFLEIFSLEP